jgi:hypothetical protein
MITKLRKENVQEKIGELRARDAGWNLHDLNITAQ